MGFNRRERRAVLNNITLEINDFKLVKSVCLIHNNHNYTQNKYIFVRPTWLLQVSVNQEINLITAYAHF